MGLVRTSDWPERLADVVAAATSRPYRLGEWDCLRFACACIAAMTGEDFWPRFAGEYTTRRAALKAIAAIARDLEAAITATLGVSPAPTFSAQRGDLVLFKDDAGEHIGVCLGGSVAVLGPAGLLPLPITAPGLGPCWRVG
ncbi:MAG: hypothetical protein KJ787_13885 [Gammaproteobacteria bacterium]|nr:hypothetical protein [Gammaproteobacteria bacterium]MBU1647417.1 hypothetical protein [Gammaproteobacteria bacterium]MBU1973209.1 hypothetical protein [Gammaproteobacteria bacterium]